MTTWLRSAVAPFVVPVCFLLPCSQLFSQQGVTPALAAYESGGPPSDHPANSSSNGADPAEVAIDPLPPAPEPAASGGLERWNTEPSGTAHQGPFSRIGIGTNLSPLGIGINATTVLSDFFDVRVVGNFFSYSSSQFEVNGFKGIANAHLASMTAALDWYPFNSVWRLSPGLMLVNDNQFSLTSGFVAGTSFNLNGKKFYSASANPVTGATPLIGSGVLGLHTHKPAFTLTGGFGKFVPRSNRHWSYPSEFGVVFMGPPTADVTLSGWACLDPQQTQCSDVSNPANPIGQQFNTALQSQLTKWRRDLGKISIYPILSYGVVYSFNSRRD